MISFERGSPARAARAFGRNTRWLTRGASSPRPRSRLVSRDLSWPLKDAEAARIHARRARRPFNAAHAGYLAIRRLLLIGRSDEAERRLAELDPRLLPPRRGPPTSWSWRGSPSGASGRRRRALRSLGRSAQPPARIPALTAEVKRALLVLSTPAARLIARGEERLLLLQEVEELLARSKHSSWTLAVTSCVTRVRWSRWQADRCCSRLHARWPRHGRETSQGRRSCRAHSDRSSRMNRTRGCESKSGGFGRCFAP